MRRPGARKPPLQEIAPEYHVSNHWKSGGLEPRTRGGIRDASKNCKLLGVQRLIEFPLARDLLKTDAKELLVLIHLNSGLPDVIRVKPGTA